MITAPFKPRPLPDWDHLAECKGADINIFYPTEPGYPTEARRICGRCPVQTQCLDHATDTIEPFGIWGGVGEEKRRAARRTRRNAA